MYEFTNPLLANELIAAVHRGVNVSILLEGAPVGGIIDTEQAIARQHSSRQALTSGSSTPTPGITPILAIVSIMRNTSSSMGPPWC